MPEKFYPWSGLRRLWEKVGTLQFDFLVGEGLKPYHTLLDVGCGTCRGGRFFIDYLEAGRYYGLDEKQSALSYAWRHTLTKPREKEPTFRQAKMGNEHVDLAELMECRWFDFALLYALLDHMPPANVKQTLFDVAKVSPLTYATAFISASREPLLWQETETYFDQDPWHHPLSLFEEIAADAGSKLEICEGHEHPLGLSMLKFERMGELFEYE